MLFEGAGLRLRGGARDLRTNATGKATVLGAAELDAELDAARNVTAIQTSPQPEGVTGLVGLPAGKGFRAATTAALPRDHALSTPLFLLLDELPVATLISGYALLYTGQVDTGSRKEALKADICSGWRSDGTMMVSVRRGGGVPVPLGPSANPIEDPADPLSWHGLDALPAGAMRRRRMVDVTAGASPEVWAMFRDSHVNEDGQESVLHEYVVEGRIDPSGNALESCVATPTVLPWTECPEAAMSAGRLVGVPLPAIRDQVRREFTGTSTCTHLNDLLRSLGDLEALKNHI